MLSHRPGLVVALFIALGIAASCYHLPEWNGDVDVSPLENAARTTCGDGDLTAAGAQEISRLPYLQSTTTSDVVVVWGSKSGEGEVVVRDTDGEIVARTAGDYAGNEARKKARLAAQRDGEQGLDAEDILLLAADISALEPGELYCYQLVSGPVILSEPAPLATASSPGDSESMRFVVLGDTGTGGAAQAAIAKRLTAETFDFMLFLGDIAYSSGSYAQLQGKFFEVYRDFLPFVPAFPTIGNHERRTRRGAPYLESFVLPDKERYYSFDWGDVHFVAFDTTRLDKDQREWLEDDLAKNELPWVIAFGHHPLYSNSLRRARRSVRAMFEPIFARHDVDIVLTGHEHHYERFRVLGLHHIISGGGGGRLTRLFGKSLALRQRAVHHYLSFEVSESSLLMRAIDIEGDEFDRLELKKSQ